MPCGGGFKLRWREARDTSAGECRGPWAQTESCNMGSCPGKQYPSIPKGMETGALEMAPEGHWCLCPGGLEWKRGSAGGRGEGSVSPVHTCTSGPQERAVRPGTLCLPSTVPTGALAAALTSGRVFSVYRDPAAQVSRLGSLGCPDSLHYRSRGGVRQRSGY